MNFMKIAEVVSEESKCISLQVGAVIVKNKRIISTGYNGTTEGLKNCNQHFSDLGMTIDGTPNTKLKDEFKHMHHEWSKKNEIHAELNAILFAAKNGISIEGSTLYTTHSPCPDCSKAISQSGIKRVVYKNLYARNEDGWDRLLINSGIDVIMQKDK